MAVLKREPPNVGHKCFGRRGNNTFPKGPPELHWASRGISLFLSHCGVPARARGEVCRWIVEALLFLVSRKDPGCSRPAALSPSSRELLARCTRHTAAEMLRLGVQLATKGGQSESSLPRLALPLSNERARGSEKPEAGEGEAPDRSWDRRPARRVMLKKEN